MNFIKVYGADVANLAQLWKKIGALELWAFECEEYLFAPKLGE